MSLKHAILSLLLESDKTGYDLNKSFQGSIAYYWSASHQQIYKTLADMLKDNWVQVRVSEQDSKPDKKIYGISKEGKHELTQWALQPIKPSGTKNPLLIKLLLTPLVGTEVILQLLKQRLIEVESLQHTYSDIEQTHFASAESLPLSASVKHLTLRCGIEHAQAEKQWLIDAIKRLSTHV